MPKSTRVPPDVAQEVRALAGDRCEWCDVDYTFTPGVEIHHRLPRGRARNLHDVHNMVLLCTAHHQEAHSTAEWPWLVPGSTLRGEYVGPDPLYAWVVNGGEEPPLSRVIAAFPDADGRYMAWAVRRARLVT